tara:strand:- start:9399 stop:9593 length:195 start_codon:yes stop_codon:yes gene_type:complete
MSIFTKCGIDCPHCDCGRTDNECKFKDSKKRGKIKALGIIPNKTVVKKKESQKDKKKRRKKGRK